MRWQQDKFGNRSRNQSWLPTVLTLLGVILAVGIAVSTTVLLPDENRVLPAPGVGEAISHTIAMRSHDPQTVEQGRVYYVQLCLSCHGVRGDGSGEWAYRVTPYPADLRATRTQRRSDQELFGIISDGLVATPMIGWKQQLSTAQRWQLIAYLRTLRDNKTTIPGGGYEQ